MKSLVFILSFFCSFTLFSQCIVVTESAEIPVTLVDMESFAVTSENMTTGEIVITVQADDASNPGSQAPDGQAVPIYIVDQNGTVLADVDLIVGQTTVSGFLNDTDDKWTNDFVPYITSDNITGADLLAGTVTITLNKRDQAKGESWYYTDGSWDGSIWTSPAKKMTWTADDLVDTMFRAVQLVTSSSHHNITVSPYGPGHLIVDQTTKPDTPFTLITYEAYIDGSLSITGSQSDLTEYGNRGGADQLDYIFDSLGVAVAYDLDATADSTYFSYTNFMWSNGVTTGDAVDYAQDMVHVADWEDTVADSFQTKHYYRDQIGTHDRDTSYIDYESHTGIIKWFETAGGSGIRSSAYYWITGATPGTRFDVEVIQERTGSSAFPFRRRFQYELHFIW